MVLVSEFLGRIDLGDVSRGIHTLYAFVPTPNSGHAFAQCVRHGTIIRRPDLRESQLEMGLPYQSPCVWAGYASTVFHLESTGQEEVDLDAIIQDIRFSGARLDNDRLRLPSRRIFERKR